MLALLALAPGARAQDVPVPPTMFPTAEGPQFLTLDQDRLFSESLFGKRVAQEIEDRSKELAAENRRIEAELEAEEKALTEERPKLAADEFRKKADAFDAKVQKLRAEQDAKSRALTSFRDTEQQRFAKALGPILASVAGQRNALAVIDRRVLLVTSDAIDITDEVVAAIDDQLGDGADSAPPIPEAPPPDGQGADPGSDSGLPQLDTGGSP